VPPLCGQQQGNGQKVRRHSLYRLNASMSKQKKTVIPIILYSTLITDTSLVSPTEFHTIITFRIANTREQLCNVTKTEIAEVHMQRLQAQMEVAKGPTRVKHRESFNSG